MDVVEWQMTVGFLGPTSPQIDTLPNSEPNRGNKTHKADSFGTGTSHPAENLTFFLLHTSPARFSMLSKRDEFFPVPRPPFLCLNLLGRKEIGTLRRQAAKVDVRFTFGCVRLHRARVSPTTGSAVLPAHLPLPPK